MSISVSPSEVTLAPGESQVFTATVIGSAGTGVMWSTSGGELVSLGMTATFTAPVEVGEYVVTATSAADPGRWASAMVTVEALDGMVVVVAPVAPLPGAGVGDLMVVTPYGEYALPPGVGDGSFTVVPGLVSVVALMDVSRDFGWTAVWPAWFDAAGAAGLSSTATTRLEVDELVGSLSTAVALVFIHPGIYHVDVAVAREVVDVLKVVPEVVAFGAVLEAYASEGDPLGVPVVAEAYEAALEAAFLALGVFDDPGHAAAGEVRLAGEDRWAIDFLALDSGVVSWSVDGRSVTPGWRELVSSGERGRSWAGRIYEVDAGAYGGVSELQALWDQDSWRSDIVLLADPGVGGMYLAADTFWSDVDVVAFAVDAAVDWLLDSVSGGTAPKDALGVSLPDRDGLYVAHMYSCGRGLSDLSNTLDDLRLVESWPGAVDGHFAACMTNVFEMVFDVLSIIVAWDSLYTDDTVSLLQEAKESLRSTVPEAFRSAVAVGDVVLAVGFIASDLAKGLAEDAAKLGMKSLLKFKARQLLHGINVLSLASNAGKITARYVAGWLMTPVESRVFVVGSPWQAAVSVSPRAVVMSVGTSVTFTANVTGVADVSVTWGVSPEGCGSIPATGNPVSYVAPAFAGTCTVTATSVVDQTKSSTASVTVTSSDGDLPSWVQVMGGGHHSLALRGDGTVWAWGRSYDGELGDGDMVPRASPVAAHGLSEMRALAAGRSHSLALRDDGTVWAWGRNEFGQLGDGSETTRALPAQVEGLSNMEALAAGIGHSLGLRADGTVWAWGWNQAGQLGDGTTSNRATPVRVAGISDVVMVAADRTHSLALRSDGSVWAWGGNSFGELGDGSTMNRLEPVQVAGLTDVIGVAAGDPFSLALRANGTVWAWGSNDGGQLGDGSTEDRLTPVKVVGLEDVTAIAAGGAHSLALLGDATVMAWGYNFYGQVGDDSTANRLVPVHVHGLTGATNVTAGGFHSLVVRDDGLALAWGRNQFGQLGDGTNSNRWIPVLVQ